MNAFLNVSYMPVALLPMDISKSKAAEPQSIPLPQSSPTARGLLRCLSDSALCKALVVAPYDPVLFSCTFVLTIIQDTVRDVRGFATKFYTEEGNWVCPPFPPL